MKTVLDTEGNVFIHGTEDGEKVLLFYDEIDDVLIQSAPLGPPLQVDIQDAETEVEGGPCTSASGNSRGKSHEYVEAESPGTSRNSNQSQSANPIIVISSDSEEEEIRSRFAENARVLRNTRARRNMVIKGKKTALGGGSAGSQNQSTPRESTPAAPGPVNKKRKVAHNWTSSKSLPASCGSATSATEPTRNGSEHVRNSNAELIEILEARLTLHLQLIANIEKQRILRIIDLLIDQQKLNNLRQFP